MDNDLELSVTRRGDEILVSVETDGVSNSYNNMSIISGNSITSQSAVVINNFGSNSNGGLMLDVQIPSKAFEQFSVESKNGNVDVTIGNIGTSNVSVDSKNGRCKNNPKLRGIYTVSGYITSKNGNAKFH